MTMTTPMLDAVPDDGLVADPGSNDPSARPRRRRFSAEYKQKILDEYGRCGEPGEKSALLRREGLYSSHLTEWRKARDAGAVEGLKTQTRKPRRTAAEDETERLRRRAERAEAELARTRAALEIMGKAHALLELLSESADCDTEPPSSSRPSRW